MVALFGAGTVLAGLLIFASAPLYPAYAEGDARLLGLMPLRDQQLAGIVMTAEQLVALGLCGWFLLRAQVSVRPTPVRPRLAHANLHN